jgi:hypothetical protein
MEMHDRFYVFALLQVSFKYILIIVTSFIGLQNWMRISYHIPSSDRVTDFLTSLQTGAVMCSHFIYKAVLKFNIILPAYWMKWNIYIQLTTWMQQRPSWEDDSRSGGHVTSRILWNPYISYRVQSSPTLDQMLSQFNPFRTKDGGHMIW